MQDFPYKTIYRLIQQFQSSLMTLLSVADISVSAETLQPSACIFLLLLLGLERFWASTFWQCCVAPANNRARLGLYTHTRTHTHTHTHTHQRGKQREIKHAFQLNSHKIHHYGTFLLSGVKVSACIFMS